MNDTVLRGNPHVTCEMWFAAMETCVRAGGSAGRGRYMADWLSNYGFDMAAAWPRGAVVFIAPRVHAG